MYHACTSMRVPRDEYTCFHFLFPFPKLTNARFACAAILSCLESDNSCKSSNPPHENIISLLFTCFNDVVL